MMTVSGKRRLAQTLQRWPWSVRAAQMLWRRFIPPWMTAGSVGAVYNEQGKILIVEHVFHPKFPWGLPGGWMSHREDPSDTIRREMREETGLDIIVERPLLISATAYLPNHLDIAFLCRAQPGHVKLSGELLDYKWIDPADAPPMLTFHTEVIRAAIKALEHRTAVLS